MNQENKNIEIKRSAQLSITEICIGSVGHGLKIPFTGHLLSLNQLAFLLNILNFDRLPKAAVFEVSGIAAILKSFSPAGQKLGPMLSIAMQGFLFWISLLFFGANLLGQIIGAIFLAIWAFIQPVVTLFFIYGFHLVELFQFYSAKIKEDYPTWANSILYLIGLLVVLKLVAATAMALYSNISSKEIKTFNQEKMKNFFSEQFVKKDQTSPFKGAIKDLFRPIFLLSFILMLVFIQQINGTIGEKIWLGMRPLGIAFVLFYMMRSPMMAQKVISFSKRSKSFETIYLKAQSALNFMTERSAQGSEVSSRRQVK